MEQKYVYLSYEEQAFYDDVLTEVLDALEHDVGGEVDEDLQ